MAKNRSPIKIPEQYLSQIQINGLNGRCVQVPPNNDEHSDREFIFFYGHHGSIERVYAFAEYLADYGKVTIYDVPGLGGMDSFYKVGKKPTLDMYADYLQALFKVHNKSKHTTVVGMSLTFTMLTRTLQKYPETVKYFDNVVSFVGFASYKNFKFKKSTFLLGKYVSLLLTIRPLAWLVRVIVFNPLSLSLLMGAFLRYNPKLRHVKAEERRATVQMEKDLWRRNDMRTHFATYVMMLTLKYPRAPKIATHVYNMSTGNDQYFDAKSVESSLKRLYESVSNSELILDVHVPSLIATKKDVAKIVPASVRDEVLSNG